MFVLAFTARVLALPVIAGGAMLAGTEDPFTAFFSHDWASVGGWSLFVSLCLFITLGSFREWWAPGPRVKRLENLVSQQQELIKQQSIQLGKSLETNEFTKYVMDQVIPRPSKQGHKSTVARRSTAQTNEESSP